MSPTRRAAFSLREASASFASTRLAQSLGRTGRSPPSRSTRGLARLWGISAGTASGPGARAGSANPSS
eukprot:2543068-Alexandrium_andersonii.AAC.1